MYNDYMANYRHIWSKHNGPIPKEPNGRSYEIHHNDGNHKNDDIGNLQCVTIQEHYDIHHSQGDYGAARKIAFKMNLTPEEISKLCTDSNLKRVEEGTHPFIGGDVQRISAQKALNDGTFHTNTMHICPHCSFIGKGNPMKQWHFNNCKMRPEVLLLFFLLLYAIYSNLYYFNS